MDPKIQLTTHMGAHLEELCEAIGWILRVIRPKKCMKIILEGPPI
jgi:hypothetical protein